MGEVGTSIPVLDVLISVYVWNLQKMEPCVQSKKNPTVSSEYLNINRRFYALSTDNLRMD